MASSPVSIRQSEMNTLRQPVGSMPSVFGPITGFRIVMPRMKTWSQLMGRSVQPDAFSMRTSSMRTFLQPANSISGDARSSGFQS